MMTAMTDEMRWNEFREYTEKYSMSRYERRLLRDWVRSGHSVYEPVDPMYVPGSPNPPMDFLEAYRFDREMREDMRGMTKDEKLAYLQAFWGYEDPAPEQTAMDKAKQNTPEIVSNHIRHLERELHNLWCFVWQEGLGDEAKTFVTERKDEAIPFEW